MVHPRFDLCGKLAVITGASRGIGAALAVGLAEAGADIALIARGDCAQTQEAVERTGRTCRVVPADLGQPGAGTFSLGEIITQSGLPDILINNAGTIRRADFVAHARSDWDDVLAVNLDAVFELSQALARHWVEQHHPGRIINIASMLSFQGGVRVVGYTAAKSALLGLTRAMANELAAVGINVNAIAPGYIATDNTAPLRADPGRSRAILERIPAGRWGEPADLVGAAVFLASPAAAYIHGAVLPVDGGWLAR